MHSKNYPTSKRLARYIYSKFISSLSFVPHIKSSSATPKVFFGGARPGNAGGAMVKVRRLKSRFIESHLDFNIIYSLSNCPYLTKNAIQVFKSKNIPIIHNQNGVFYPAWFDGDWEKENDKMKHAYLNADYVFWQSKFCKKCAEHFIGKRSGPGEVLYNAVDTLHFIPEQKSEKIRPFTFLINGKLDNHLSYRILLPLECFKNLIDEGLKLHLRIAGSVEPELRSIINDVIRQLNLVNHVSITDSYTQDEAPKIYNSCDAVVMIKQNDPCPNTVIEAMSCGLPIVYVTNGGLPELVGEECGYPVNCDENFNRLILPNRKELTDAMRDAALDRTQKKGKMAREKALALFDVEGWLTRHNDVFKKYLGK